MAVVRYVLRQIGLRSLLDVVVDRVANPKRKLVEGVLVTTINIVINLRLGFFFLRIYTDDPSWLKYDRLAQVVASFQLSLLLLGSLFLLWVFVSVVSYIYYFTQMVDHAFVVVDELLVVNVRDIHHSNQGLWESLRKDLVSTNPIHRPRKIKHILQQAYHEGFIGKRRIVMKSRYHLLPVVYPIVRIRFAILMMALQILYTGIMPAVCPALVPFLHILWINYHSVAILLEMALIMYHMVFLFKLHFHFTGLFLMVHLNILLTLKHLETIIESKLRTQRTLTWKQVRNIFRSHARMFNYLIERNRVASKFASLYFWFTFEFNVIVVTNLLLGKFSSFEEVFFFVCILFFQVLVMLGIVLFSTNITKTLHRVHVHFIPLQLKSFGPRMPRPIQAKLMSYYERLNSDHLNATNIFGIGTITNNNMISFILLYTMYIFFAIDLIRS